MTKLELIELLSKYPDNITILTERGAGYLGIPRIFEDIRTSHDDENDVVIEAVIIS